MRNAAINPWLPLRIGSGEVSATTAPLRLSFAQASADRYTDAEIHDYARPQPAHFRWRPPLRLLVRARASHPAATEQTDATQAPLLGTAGFGFWNAPFARATLSSRLPDAVWFFYASPPARMDLVPGSPGWGWKAQVVHANRWGALAMAIPTLATMAWARLSRRTVTAARWVQRLSGARETLLTPDLTAWHDYQLDWERDAATFTIDGTVMARLPNPPRGPLGFVAWIDNQYAIVTPRGEFRTGILATGPQWLDLAEITITSLV